jgi:hypothetical protein
MKTRVIAAILLALCLRTVAAEAPAQPAEPAKPAQPAESAESAKSAQPAESAKPSQNKEKMALRSLLDSLKTKGETTRKTRHILSLPVASAGARGAEIRTASRFALLWPDGAHISPLTALSVNLEATAAGGKAGPGMREQLSDFVEVFPEFRKEPLLEDLSILLRDLDQS